MLRGVQTLGGRVAAERFWVRVHFSFIFFCFPEKIKNLVRMRCDDWLHDLTA